jgi:hypothetical protein
MLNRLRECPPVSDCDTNSPDGGTRLDPALPNPHNRPTGPAQPLGNSQVAAHVRLNFFPPKFPIAAREILARTSVPEASVDEHRDLQTRPCKIRSADDRPVFSVSTETGRPKNPPQCQLRRSIALRTHRSHNPGPDMDGNMIHGAPIGVANGMSKASDPRPRFDRMARGSSGVPQRL